MPDDLHGFAVAFGGEFEGDFGAGGVVFGVFVRVVAFDFGGDGGRGIEVERPEGGVEDVADPVADAAGAEGGEAAPVEGR